MESDLNLPKLDEWLQQHLPDHSKTILAEKFPGGQSNPTYRLTTGSQRFVLRRKPFGNLLPSAHAIDREFRILSALRPLGYPVPRSIGLCTDESIIGAMFYVMELVNGRILWNGTLPEQAPATRKAIYHEIIHTLAKLHSIDYESAGLSDFGRAGNYFQRQIDRWTRQYRASETNAIPEMEQLIQWLPTTIPPQERSSIVHGDYRIDNLIFAADETRIAAVIDWELSTIGDPLADFANFLMNWIMPPNQRSGLRGTDFAGTGIPAMEEAVEIYCQATERPGVPDLHWYFAFNQFRLACIGQGIKRRALDGNASNAAADAASARILPTAQSAWAEAKLTGTT
ncbi:aminoglycoside phosphotransferase [Sphingobium chlorophenolicum L-1]|uniref:Aminoglycoside phosphotransferase n=1 Tax=Sphingobium chlorophenolicum L-1 TaxID=690566 RepID=F6EWC3_SPHCR|nr:aminoglycoside phosphotransferase [Sphingobium chlorophenolicum L-1]